MAEILERILRRLHTAESVITNLYPPSDFFRQRQTRKTVHLMQNLSQLEQIISNISPNDHDLINEWRDTVIQLWKQINESNNVLNPPHTESTKKLQISFDPPICRLPISLNIDYEVAHLRSLKEADAKSITMPINYHQKSLESRTCPSEIADILERILCKLLTPQVIIKDLLKMNPKPNPVLLEKLSQIEMFISDDLDNDICDDNWVQEWRERVIIIWAKFSSVNYYSPNGIIIQNLPTSISISPSSIQNDSSIPTTFVRLFNNQLLLLLQSPTDSEYFDDDHDIPLSTDEIRLKLQNEFNKIDHAESILELEQLLGSVVSAEYLIKPHFHDVLLQSDVFAFAVAQLPSNKLKLFATFLHQRKEQIKLNQLPTISDLRQFLQADIFNYYDQINLCTDRLENSHLIPTSTDLCYCCKAIGHHVDHCPNLTETICYKCFRFGHTEGNCTLVEHCSSLCLNCGKVGHIGKSLFNCQQKDFLIRSSVKKAFIKLVPVDCISNIEAMKQLLILMAKTCELILPFKYDFLLKQDACSSAFYKFPSDLQEVFLDCCHRNVFQKNNFADLQAFIHTEFIDYIRLIDMMNNSDDIGEHSFLLSLCTRCFQFGHEPKYCNSPTKIAVRFEDL